MYEDKLVDLFSHFTAFPLYVKDPLGKGWSCIVPVVGCQQHLKSVIFWVFCICMDDMEQGELVKAVRMRKMNKVMRKISLFYRRTQSNTYLLAALKSHSYSRNQVSTKKLSLISHSCLANMHSKYLLQALLNKYRIYFYFDL